MTGVSFLFLSSSQLTYVLELLGNTERSLRPADTIRSVSLSGLIERETFLGLDQRLLQIGGLAENRHHVNWLSILRPQILRKILICADTCFKVRLCGLIEWIDWVYIPAAFLRCRSRSSRSQSIASEELRLRLGILLKLAALEAPQLRAARLRQFVLPQVAAARPSLLSLLLLILLLMPRVLALKMFAVALDRPHT